MKRYCESFIIKDLAHKMVFIGGPRQVGKTTLSKALCQYYAPEYQYFNWDYDEDRKAILQQKWLNNSQLIVFDEIHKFPRWKQWIKGIYDVKPANQQYLVTGSARLDIYRRGGDSLMGRYHYWRLFPLTMDELPIDVSSQEGYERLLSLGGFPEPFLLDSEREARRWRKERFERILREDVRDLENIFNIQLLQLFVDALRERVGGLITLSNIAQDLHISPKTAKMWLLLIERMYIGFAIYPFTRNIPRAIQKPPKFYFYDNADTLNDQGSRLENFVAVNLLKRLHFMEDYHGHTCQLHYLRDKEGREIDFVTVIDGEIDALIEVKQSDSTVSKSLEYYQQKLKPKKAIQLVGNLTKPYDKADIQVRHPIEFFVKPPWGE